MSGGQCSYPQPDRCSASKRKQIGRTVETAGLVLGDQGVCAFSAAELRVPRSKPKQAILSWKIDLSFVDPLLWTSFNGREIVRPTNDLRLQN